MKKVICLISGGIDSGLSAFLLKKSGFEVFGVFLKLGNSLLFDKSQKNAKKIANFLKIPFYSIDLRKDFKEKVINYFLTGYKNGITPNPCVICNKEIKFGFSLEKHLKIKFDFIATGHYARKVKDLKSKKFKLLRARDKKKDQSYFLWMLNQEQLKRILFPIGDYTRKEVEKLAKKNKLPISKSKKSVDICFVKTTINDFLERHLKKKPGKIITKNGKVIGYHNGLWFYTIGQRKGLGLSGGPYYVLDKNLKENVLIVTKKEKDLLKRKFYFKNENWISGKTPKLPLRIKTKVRYNQVLKEAILKKEKNKYFVEFKKSQKAITPGQSAVFYKGEELLGGGIIEK